MASEAVEILKSLREQKLQRMLNNRATIERTERENEMLKVSVEALDEAICSVEGTKPDTGTLPIPEVAQVAGGYRDMGLQDAVLDVINKQGKSPGLFATEILKLLRHGGYESGAADDAMYSAVYTTCLRLLGKGKIGEAKRDEKRSFVRVFFAQNKAS